VTLAGTTYPALSAGTAVTLFFYRDGSWSSVAVPAGSISSGTRTLTVGGAAYGCSFTTYRFTVTPPASTTYYFAVADSQPPAVADSQSPQVSISIGGAPAPTPAPTTAAGIAYRTEATRRFVVRRGGLAVDQSPVSIVITDPDGRVQYVNPKFIQATGLTLEDVLDRDVAAGKYTKSEEQLAREREEAETGVEKGPMVPLALEADVGDTGFDVYPQLLPLPFDPQKLPLYR